MYCIIKCIVQEKQAPSFLHSCNVKTQICVTRPQCVKMAMASNIPGNTNVSSSFETGYFQDI